MTTKTLTDELAAVIQQRLFGLDVSYMSDEEIARTLAQAIAERLEQVGWYEPPAGRAPYIILRKEEIEEDATLLEPVYRFKDQP